MIHPIAGKCKHCKAELTTFHAARPAANTPLPALRPSAAESSQASGHANGHARAAHAAVPAVVAAYDASQPVLPPRPTGRGHDPEPRASSWRSWPVLVIILATVAIVVAVVLMVWPSRHDGDGGGKRTLAPMPAPDRMQTEPEIKAPQANPQILPPAKADPADDPWTDRPDPPAPDPSAGAIDQPDDDDVAGLIDPFGSPHPSAVPPGRRRLNTNRRGMMMLAMAEHMCRKMVQCGADDPLVKATCDGFARRPPTSPVHCAAADRCLRRIDTLSCGSPSGDSFLLPQALMAQFQDCAEAVRC